MPPLTPDQVADAFRASMVRQRNNFERKRRDFHTTMSNTSMYPTIYLDRLMQLLEDEVNERMALAEKGIRDLLDSGWKPVGHNAILGALNKMFEVYDHRQDPTSDLRAVAEMGNGYIGLPNPGGQQNPALRLGRMHVDAHTAGLKRLEAYVVKEQPPAGNVFHGPTQFVAGDGNTVNYTNVAGDMDARSILHSTSIVRQHIND